MCGIFGYSYNDLEKSGKSLSTALRHRGPDDAGIFSDEYITLGHRRLSIIDLSPTGHQPMSTEDGRYTIVFNGEIYNYIELRSFLEKDGFRFKGNSDTEVLLVGFKKFGLEVVKKLRGMWAFAIYDSDKKKLFLSRDFFGIKPLLYAHGDGGRFAFASEMKGVMEIPWIRKIVDPIAAELYFALGFIPPPYTLFSGVKKLMPGEMMTIDMQNGAVIREFCRFPSSSEKRDNFESKDVDELHSVLLKSLEKHLIADVPVGLFFSGGTDSTLLALLLKELGQNLETYHVSVPERPDTEYARSIAKVAGLPYTEIYFTKDIIRDIDTEVWDALDEPLADSAVFPLLLMSKKAARKVRVVLTGEGGDELFGGYGRHHWLSGLRPADGGLRGDERQCRAVPDVFNFLPRQWKRKAELFWVRNIFRNPLLLWASFMRPHHGIAVNRQAYEALQKILSFCSPEEDLAFYYDRALYLPGDLLYKTDIITMSQSLEARVPLLDREVWKYATGFSYRAHHKGREGKVMMKTLLERLLPHNVVFRPKQGFSIPLKDFLIGSLPEIEAMSKQFAGNLETLPQWVSSIILSAMSERGGIKWLAEKEKNLLYAFWVYGKILRRYNI